MAEIGLTSARWVERSGAAGGIFDAAIGFGQRLFASIHRSGFYAIYQ